MAYYKFLTSDRRGPFSGVRWPWVAGESKQGWVQAVNEIAPCRSGLHACRPADLPYWLDASLWEVEFDGPVVETPYKVVGTRARLVCPIQRWNADNAAVFRLVCICRTGEHAVAELREAGLDAAADQLHGATQQLWSRTGQLLSTGGEEGSGAHPEDSSGTVELQRVGDAVSQALNAAVGSRYAERLCQYAEDALYYAGLGDTAGVAFIPVHAHDSRTRVEVPDPFTAERQWQAEWLTTQLDISLV